MTQRAELPAGVVVRRASDRFATTTDWLDSHSCFSFGDHYDPADVGFGALSVSNHEVLRAGSGFDDHPHADAEIVTWMISGSLVHQDSRGHTGVTGRGLAQRMSAGSGLVHTERNDAFRVDPSHPPAPAEYVQMWVLPDESGLEPSYAQRHVDLADLERGWVPVASGSRLDAAVPIASAGSTLWVSRLSDVRRHQLPGGPRAHAYVATGEVEVEAVGRLGAGDALRLDGDATSLWVAARSADAEILVWELAGPA